MRESKPTITYGERDGLLVKKPGFYVVKEKAAVAKTALGNSEQLGAITSDPEANPEATPEKVETTERKED